MRGRKPKGSSPHTRGLLYVSCILVSFVRIIPAYAGPTYRQALAFGACQDHPRIRGAYQWKCRRGSTLLGSSPHTRGLLGVRYEYAAQSRIIPAYAGPTLRAGSTNYPAKDHPRIRGAYLDMG